MKKLKNYYFALLAIASVSFLTSCGGDDEPNPKATIGFTPSATEITAAPGQKLDVLVQVTSADKLKEFKVTASGAGLSQEITKVTSFPSAGYEYKLAETVPNIPDGSQIVYTFTATTNKDEVTTKTYTVKILSYATYTARILGNQNASSGSFFASTTGQVLNSADAKTNSAKVDLVYYYSVGGTAATDLATIASPTDVTAQAVYGASSSANIPSWATKNDTKLKALGTSATTYDNLNSGSAIATAYMGSSATEGSKVTTLAAGNVFGFMTASGKHGVAKVISVTLPTTANGNKSEINLEVKVQQ